MLKKRYLKSKPSCQAPFYTTRELDAQNVALAGDFNAWDESATPMKPLKDGRFKATLELPLNRQFQFRYLMDNSIWHDDWAADHYVPNSFKRR